jgi:hypothetical protein
MLATTTISTTKGTPIWAALVCFMIVLHAHTLFFPALFIKKEYWNGFMGERVKEKEMEVVCFYYTYMGCQQA